MRNNNNNNNNNNNRDIKFKKDLFLIPCVRKADKTLHTNVIRITATAPKILSSTAGHSL